MISLYFLKKPIINSNEHQTILAIAESWLCKDAFNYGNRYRHPNKQLSYYCSRLLIRYALAKQTQRHPIEFIISRSDIGGGLQATLRKSHKSPSINPSQPLPTFSISHTTSTVGLIMTNNKHYDIGLDLESRERPASGIGLSRRYFSEEVAEWVANQQQPNQAFLQIWTQAEALVKAAKTGMGNNTKPMAFAFTTDIATLQPKQSIGHNDHLSWQSKTAIYQDLQWSAVVGLPISDQAQCASPILSHLAPEQISLSSLVTDYK